MNEPNGNDDRIAASPDRTEEFVRLLGETQRYRFAYLMSLMNDRDAVDEVLQETNLVLWREFGSFQPGTNFVAWSCQVAFNQMRTWRKKQQRNRLQFSNEFLEAIAEELETHSEGFEERLEALRECVAALPDHRQELIRWRYTDGQSVDAIAESMDRSKDAVYRLLSRVRKTLHQCVSGKLVTGGG